MLTETEIWCDSISCGGRGVKPVHSPTRQDLERCLVRMGWALSSDRIPCHLCPCCVGALVTFLNGKRTDCGGPSIDGPSCGGCDRCLEVQGTLGMFEMEWLRPPR